MDYGKGLQEFFLKNYKILTIIESKVERWFPDADVNTCIVILEKCSGEKHKKEREENLVRFVQLLKPLRHFIPPAEDMWSKEAQRLHQIDLLIQQIMSKHDFYQSEGIKIFPKLQKELWEEGYDEDKNKYVGSKWGKYLRAPDIFFKILEKGKGKLVPLKEVAEVRRGFTTGASEFFYLTEEEIKRWGIEKESWMHQDERGNWVPNYVLVKANELQSINVDPSQLNKRVLMIHKAREEIEGTNVSKYIEEGERKSYHERPTCSARELARNWFDLGEEIRDAIAFPERVRARYIIFRNTDGVFLNKNLYGINAREKAINNALCAALNSTTSFLFLELLARQPGGGGGPLDIDVEVAEITSVPKTELLKANQDKIAEAFQALSNRPILSIFEELGAYNPQDVTLEGVKPDRRELDKIIMGEILGLTEEEQLEVYRAVVDLVKSRIEKAKSVQKKPKTKEGINVDALVETTMTKVKETGLFQFYRDKILSQETIAVTLPSFKEKIETRNTLMGWELQLGRHKISCSSELQARYLKVFAELGMDKIQVPVKDDHLSLILEELEHKCQIAQGVINEFLNSIVDKKLRQSILNRILEEIRKEMEFPN